MKYQSKPKTEGMFWLDLVLLLVQPQYNTFARPLIVECLQNKDLITKKPILIV